MHDDDHDDAVHDAVRRGAVRRQRRSAGPSPGPPRPSTRLSRRQISGYYRRHYKADGLVFSAAGSVDHNALVAMVRSAFGQAGALGLETAGPRPVRPPGAHPTQPAATVVVERPAEQTTVRDGRAGVPAQPSESVCLGSAELRAGRRHLEPALPGGARAARACLHHLLVRQPARRLRLLRHRRRLHAAQPAECPRHLPRRAGQGGVGGAHRRGVRAGQRPAAGSLVMGLEDSSSRMTRIGKAELVPGGSAQHRRDAGPDQRGDARPCARGRPGAAHRRAHAGRPRPGQSRQQAAPDSIPQIALDCRLRDGRVRLGATPLSGRARRPCR